MVHLALPLIRIKFHHRAVFNIIICLKILFNNLIFGHRISVGEDTNR
jgi:hypothetical protein